MQLASFHTEVASLLDIFNLAYSEFLLNFLRAAHRSWRLTFLLRKEARPAACVRLVYGQAHPRGLPRCKEKSLARHKIVYRYDG